MKLTASIFLTAAFMSAQAMGYSQSISFSANNVPIQRLFSVIKQQTGYVVFYNQELLAETRPVTVHAQNQPLGEFLANVMKDQPLNFRIDGKDIIFSRKPMLLLPEAIAAIIKGKVMDENGNPLPGATIRVKGGNATASTDGNGEFTLKNAPANAVLIITYIGYKPLEITPDGSSVNVRMEPAAAALNQVMVTGYQTISRERATGAFTTVNNDILSRRPVSNLSSALQGLVAGMQAKENEDGTMDLLIRGNTSLYGDRRPLVVVDGFPVSSSNFADINPNDVESVTVLKDAAAASIWGARSANGVIVVTTKKSKSAGKLQVDASAFTRISRMADLNQLSTQASAADLVAYEKLAYKNNWVFYPYAGGFSDINNSLTLAEELIYGHRDGLISEQAMNAGLDSLSKINNRPQIRDLLMQRAVLNQYNVSIRSGGERAKTYASMLYENNKGNFQKNSYDRYILNLQNDFKLAKFAEFSIGANLQYRKAETSGATIDELDGLSPYETLLNPDGHYSVNLNGYNREQLKAIPSAKFPYSDWSYNLLQEVRGRKLTNESLNARIQAGLKLRLMQGLTFDSRVQYERNRIDYADYYDESTFYVRSLVNSMTEYNPNTGTIGKSYIPKGGVLKPHKVGDKDVSRSDLESFLLRNQINFDRTFNRRHAISAIAGMELSQYTTNTVANPYTYGYFADKLQATVPPYGYGGSLSPITDFTGYPTVIAGANPVFGWQKDKYVSFYSNASYTYNYKYSVSGSIRSDASNFITDNPRLRWSPLWSLGAKWNMKEENFVAGSKNIDRLELRLTYGKNGNVERSTSTQALLNVGSSLNTSTGTITATVANNGNPGLRWEKTTTTNLGVDYALFGNKIFGSVDVYNKVGDGIIGNIALPAATGTTLQKFNNAGITNRGIEVSLGANVEIPRTPIRYSTTVTYAYNRNRINSLYNPLLYTYQILGGAFVEGRPVNSLYSFTYAGMINGVPHVTGPKGAPFSFNDVSLYNTALGLPFLNYEGTTTPPHTLGWVNTFQVKNFTLTAIFVGKMGGVFRNETFYYPSMVGSGKLSVNRWVKDVLNGDPTIPGFALPSEPKLYLWDRYAPYLSSLVESSSYIECKELTLEYALSRKVANAIHLANAKAFIQSRDLGLIWADNKNGYNPDWLPGTNRPLQSYTIGVNLQF
ncbi:TonB-linked outer membrane protein, SusC/RagA family [Chitinophaga jiangningensis]|uniref:TonB-linked outer membrane protein, SusC/RagA family n=1 Tax=Chitinophaga jiangningensis TaxID=1419482 RepID=A0A1M7IKM7_9BACT|nr:SusC/RagA family TonB-linked outer membrane protein [Chitinophaga jiangningensis]SHM41270.1 TonB-linked outer membrane protein, SusC/RagA family [Chitinophaga jiangningensis]